MVRISLSLDDFGRVACYLNDGEEEHTLFGGEPATALADLSAAVEDARAQGYGECFWPISSGEYRWVLRRDAERLRLAVMFVRSIAIGFQHVYWGEMPFEPFAEQVQAEIQAFSSPALG
ncbi:MAG: hypothetical protein HY821_16900 [Acidobacteria bacterium]|nr:hypothetical protein [Acidobacteriota bacterium]